MKKHLLAISLILFVHQTCFANYTVEQLMEKVQSTENIEKVKVGRFLTWIGKMIGGVSDIPVVNGIHGIEVYDISACSLAAKEEIAAYIRHIQDSNGYETCVIVKEEGEYLRLMIKKEKNKIKEILLLSWDSKDTSIVKLKGNIKEEDIEILINQHIK